MWVIESISRRSRIAAEPGNDLTTIERNLQTICSPLPNAQDTEKSCYRALVCSGILHLNRLWAGTQPAESHIESWPSYNLFAMLMPNLLAGS